MPPCHWKTKDSSTKKVNIWYHSTWKMREKKKDYFTKKVNISRTQMKKFNILPPCHWKRSYTYMPLKNQIFYLNCSKMWNLQLFLENYTCHWNKVICPNKASQGHIEINNILLVHKAHILRKSSHTFNFNSSVLRINENEFLSRSTL